MPPLPKAVRDQIAAAEVIRADMNTPPAPQDPPPANPPAPAPETPPAPAPATPPAPAPAPTPPVDENDQRYRSLQGRHESLQRNYAATTERLKQLEDALALVQAQNPPSNGQQPPAPTYEKLVTPQEEDEYGQEMLSVVERKAKEVFSPELAALAARLQKIEGQVTSVVQVNSRTAQEKMYDHLGDKVPNWKELNQDDGFKDWVGGVEPFSGRTRRDLLLEAFSRQDGPRVAQFFTGYLEATGNPQDTQAKDTPPAPTPGTGAKPSLADFAAPGRARTVPPPATPDKPVYTAATITKFMADKIAGKYRGREADADAIERDIFLAQGEGRIIQ
jgi:hypothetical protein